MPKPKVLITLKPCDQDQIESLDVQLVFDKKESIGLSTFQTLGRLHREIDAVHDFELKYITMAFNYFQGFFCDQLDWPAHIPLLILFMGPTWDSRMRIAWGLLSNEEKAVALELDYELFHNYWPSLDFLHVDWRAEVDNNPIIIGSRH